MIDLAQEIRQIVGDKVKISYAADWSEYHSFEGLRPLDKLWASPEIDFVGIDAYFPLGSSKEPITDYKLIKEGWVEGEGIDYYIEDNEKKTFTDDGAKWKNLQDWFESEHWGWDAKNNQSFKTAWKPKSKPIWFVEFGFPSIDKASNKPNVFYNPECVDGGVPTHSNGKVDFYTQRASLQATLEFIKDSNFIEEAFCWCFDARGIGWQNSDYYVDGPLWKFGHWIEGKICAKKAYSITLEGNFDYQNLKVYANQIKIQLGTNFNIKDKLILVSNRNLKILADIFKVETNQRTSCDEHRIEEPVQYSNLNAEKIYIKAVNFVATAAKFNSSLIVIQASQCSLDMVKTHFHEQKSIICSDHRVEEHVWYSNLNAEKIYIKAVNFVATAAKFNSSLLVIQADQCSLEMVKTHFHEHKSWEGEEDLFGRSNTWEQTVNYEVAHPVEIIADTIIFKISENFVATCTKMMATELDLFAKNYDFNGCQLEYSIHSETSKKGLIYGRKNINEGSSRQNTEGVLIIVKDDAYIIAKNVILFQASQVYAKNLFLKAEKIRLRGSIDQEFHALKIKDYGQRIVTTACAGELSIGLELYHETTSLRQFNETLVPSVLFGSDSVQIKAQTLEKEGAIIKGGVGKFEIAEIIGQEVILHNSRKVESLGVTFAGKVGVKENVSAAVKSIEGIDRSVRQIENGSNKYAGINAAFHTYNLGASLAQLANGKVVNAGAWADLGLSYSGYEQKGSKSFESLIEFDEILGDIGNMHGALKLVVGKNRARIIEQKLIAAFDENTSSGGSFDIGLSVGRYNGSSKVSKSIGGSFSRQSGDQHYGAGASFGDVTWPSSVNASYSNGEDRFDAKWQYISLEEVESAFRPGAMVRVADNIAESLIAVKLAAIEAKLVVENILTSVGEPSTQIIFSHDALAKTS